MLPWRDPGDLPGPRGSVMSRFIRLVVSALTVALASALSSAPNAQEHGDSGAPLWEYQGEAGPNNWGDILAEYALCQTGGRQSPVDLPAGAPTTGASVDFDYRPTPLNVVNNGHTVQVNFEPGSTLIVDGTAYGVAQFHFHAPSEHTVEGVAAPLEMHIVHQADDGTLAVLGVLFYLADEDNEALAEFFSNLPAAHEDITLNGEIDLSAILDLSSPLVSYGGSLTTPPCSEGVHWFVATEAETISRAQLAAFVGVVGFNARPVQPLGERTFDATAP